MKLNKFDRPDVFVLLYERWDLDRIQTGSYYGMWDSSQGYTWGVGPYIYTNFDHHPGRPGSNTLFGDLHVSMMSPSQALIQTVDRWGWQWW
jgi:prepilin-type processing-associated H-X9-DG protein